LRNHADAFIGRLVRPYDDVANSAKIRKIIAKMAMIVLISSNVKGGICMAA
jgi:hypothetical protein